MAHHSAVMTVMIAAARKAAKSLRRDYFEVDALQVRSKGASDFVSNADTQAEDIILEELQRGRPKYGLILEERGIIEGKDNSNRFFVDPIDGTTNFLHTLPHFAISIGLERDRKPYAGLVYNPITDELYTAEHGEGAYCNDRRLRVSGRKNLDDSLFATGLPFQGKEGRELALKETEAVLEKTAGIRRFGAASLDLAMVAAGRFDAYWERGLEPWDVCAGLVLVQEAGGIYGEIDQLGGAPHLKGQVLATNGNLHETARELITSVS